MEAIMDTVSPETKLVPTRKVAARYNSSTRTIERWEADPTLDFPRPLKIKRRKFWREADLDRFDKGRARG
jgi:predicted DNA-binding transcriptional regulator AlpA